MQKLNRLAAVIAAATLLAGCYTVETQSYNVAKNSDVESAQIAVGADFSKYDRAMSGGFGIYFPTESKPPDEDLQRLREAFTDAFRARLEGFPVVEENGPTTLQVDASLIDLRNSGAAAIPNLDRSLDNIAHSGNLVFLMEIKDSMSGETLARVADSAKTPALSTGEGSETDWDSVHDAADHWAMLFRRFLDNNLAGSE